jgi:hypothetical protein
MTPRETLTEFVLADDTIASPFYEKCVKDIPDWGGLFLEDYISNFIS